MNCSGVITVRLTTLRGEVTDKKARRELANLGYMIDNTTKTRALFEINKGVGKVDGVTVKLSLPEQNRRVNFI